MTYQSVNTSFNDLLSSEERKIEKKGYLVVGAIPAEVDTAINELHLEEDGEVRKLFSFKLEDRLKFLNEFKDCGTYKTLILTLSNIEKNNDKEFWDLISEFEGVTLDEGWDKVLIAYWKESLISKNNILADLMEINYSNDISYGKLSFNIAKNKKINGYPALKESGLLSLTGKKYVDKFGLPKEKIFNISGYVSLLVKPMREQGETRLNRAYWISSLFKNNTDNNYIAALENAIDMEANIAKMREREASFQRAERLLFFIFDFLKNLQYNIYVKRKGRQSMKIEKEIMDRVYKWVNTDFIPVPQSVVKKLLGLDLGDIIDITPPAIGDRVYVSGSKNDEDGEIIAISEDRETYEVKLYRVGEVIELEDGDFTVVRDSYLPMWGTMWAFRYSSDNDIYFNGKDLEKFSDCGFRIYTSEDYGVIIGIDGAGYDFYEQHWYPLYMKLMEE